jgi:hypothetical protein
MSKKKQKRLPRELTQSEIRGAQKKALKEALGRLLVDEIMGNGIEKLSIHADSDVVTVISYNASSSWCYTIWLDELEAKWTTCWLPQEVAGVKKTAP